MIADCDGSNQIATSGCGVPSGKDGQSLRGEGTMGNEGSYTALGLESMESASRSGGQAFWNPLVRADSAGNSAWQKQAALLVGASDSHTRRDAAPAGAGKTNLSRV